MRKETSKAIIQLCTSTLLVVNAILTAAGKNPLPINESDIAMWVSNLAAVVGVAVTTYKNANFTKEAADAQKILDSKKGKQGFIEELKKIFVTREEFEAIKTPSDDSEGITIPQDPKPPLKPQNKPESSEKKLFMHTNWQKQYFMYHFYKLYPGPMDGIWGNNSKRAVKDFQSYQGLTQDGIWGKNTELKCREVTKRIQEGIGAKPDGIWGTDTTNALITYQKKHGLSQDGIFGLNTSHVMFGTPLPKPKPASPVSKKGYQYITKYNSPNYGYGKGMKGQNHPTEIVIHHWGGDGQNFYSVVNWLCNPRAGASAQYVVEAGKVACIVDCRNAAWHAGNKWHNMHSIGIECRPECTSGDMQTVAELIASIWKTYGKLKIIGHKDIVATACPGRYYAKLGQLRAMAEKIYNSK